MRSPTRTIQPRANGHFHAQRKAAASRVLEATGSALDVINAMTSGEAVTDFSPGAVEAILSAVYDRVLQAMQDEDRVDEIILHEHLREAISRTMEDPAFPWSEITLKGTLSFGLNHNLEPQSLRPRQKARLRGRTPKLASLLIGRHL